MLLLKIVLALLADRVFGEPQRWHPLIAFGRIAGGVEARVRQTSASRAAGVVAWGLAVLPAVGVAWGLRGLHPGLAWVVDVALLYFALGAQSLTEHARAIAAPLAAGNLEEARAQVGRIVSRDTRMLDEAGVARAATESVLENGNDAIFGALFWFCLLGGPGALLFRLANTLDAMWGYRTPSYLHFGWAAARIDDALNWLPARLTALAYALLGNTRSAFACWRSQAPRWDSPNAGPVMASGAGALGVMLGGPAIYAGALEQRPPLGCGNPPDAASLAAAIRLVRNSILLWLGAIALVALLIARLSAGLA